MKKILLPILLVCVLLVPVSVLFAQKVSEMLLDGEDKGFRLDIIKTIYLDTEEWTDVTADHNVITATIDVTNADGNVSGIEVRVLDEDGTILCEPKLLNVGNTLRFGPIPAWSVYTVQAKAMNSSDYFNMQVKDVEKILS